MSHRSRISLVTHGFFECWCFPRTSLAGSITAALKALTVVSRSMSSSKTVRGANFLQSLLWILLLLQGPLVFLGWSVVVWTWACWYFSSALWRSLSPDHARVQYQLKGGCVWLQFLTLNESAFQPGYSRSGYVCDRLRGAKSTGVRVCGFQMYLLWPSCS